MFFNFSLDVFLSRAAATAACSPIKADKEISPHSHTLCFSLPSGLFSESTKILCILNILGALHIIILPLQQLILKKLYERIRWITVHDYLHSTGKNENLEAYENSFPENSMKQLVIFNKNIKNILYK
jgi:hypothetical protein